MLVEIDTEVICHNGPYSNVKLSSVKKEWMLDILLDDPGSGLWVFMKDALVDVAKVSHDFNASALVKRSWFDKPHVLFAVLDWYAFLFRASTTNLLISLH